MSQYIYTSDEPRVYPWHGGPAAKGDVRDFSEPPTDGRWAPADPGQAASPTQAAPTGQEVSHNA